MSLPKCPKCNSPALEIAMSKKDVHITQNGFRGYITNPKKECKCACGNVWEE